MRLIPVIFLMVGCAQISDLFGFDESESSSQDDGSVGTTDYDYNYPDYDYHYSSGYCTTGYYGDYDYDYDYGFDGPSGGIAIYSGAELMNGTGAPDRLEEAQYVATDFVYDVHSLGDLDGDGLVEFADGGQWLAGTHLGVNWVNLLQHESVDALVAVGDFDRDGLTDVASVGAGDVQVMSGSAFMAGDRTPLLELMLVNPLVIPGDHDIDGDGVSDLVVHDRGSPSQLCVVLSTEVDAGAMCRANVAPLEVADLDADGRDEVLVAHGGQLAVFGIRDEGLSVFNLGLGISDDEDSIATGDFDADGRVDLAVVVDDHVHFYLGPLDRLTLGPGPDFDITVVPPQLNFNRVSIHSADFDGDGRTDVLGSPHYDFVNATSEAYIWSIYYRGSSIVERPIVDVLVAGVVDDQTGDGLPDVLAGVYGTGG